MAKNHSKLPKTDKSLVQWSCLYDFNLSCAFEVITLANKRVKALFHHFFLQFVHMAEISQKAHSTTT